MRIIIDAENKTIGRVATLAAKNALLRNEVIIVNSEKAIITGTKKNVFEKYLARRVRGGNAQKGPYFPSECYKILKRTVRGMLPHKEGRGREALKRVKCYNSVPKEFENETKIKIEENKKGVTLQELSNSMKGR